MRRHGTALLVLLAAALAGCSDDTPSQPVEIRNSGSIRLESVGKGAPFDEVQLAGSPGVDYIIGSLGCGAAWLDYDNDGDADLYLAQGATPEFPAEGPPDRLWRNDGDADGDGIPEFTDATDEAGLGDRLWSFGVAVADYDNDGDPDIHLSNFGVNRLYRNDGGRFSEIAAAAGLGYEGWTAGAAWSDVDHDGDLDLYLVNYVVFDFDRYPRRSEQLIGGAPPCLWKSLEIFCGPRNLEPAPDRFYYNDGDPDGDGIPSFREATAAAGFDVGEGLFGLVARFIDLDDDGDDDLYVANDSVRNSYFLNRGNGVFDESAIFAGLAYNEQGNEQAGMGIAGGDLDGDQRTDLVVTNFSHDHDTIYRNEGELLFTDISYHAGIGSPSFLTLGWGVELADFDQDGFADLFMAHGHVYPQVDGAELGTTFKQLNGLFRNRGDGTFDDVSSSSGDGMKLMRSTRAVAALDIEQDGDLDLLLTNLNEPPDLLINSGEHGNWLQVRLQGVASTRDGIGARVIVTSGGRTQYREIRRATSYAASTLPVAHFGLGDAAQVDRLEVRWPSGRITRMENVEADRLLTITEPDAR